MRQAIKYFALFFFLALVFGGITAWSMWSEYRSFAQEPASNEHEERIVEIPRGAGPMTISRSLEEAGVIRDSKLFGYLIRERKATPKLRAGEFRFWTDQSPEEVLQTLIDGVEVGYSVTLPPGLRIEEMAAKVEAAGRGKAKRYIELARDSDFIARAGLPIEPPPENLEGILLPNTYSFPRKSSADDVIAAQLKAFRAVWDERRVRRASELGMSIYEVVTLASIVEKETGVPEERPLIGGVFHNRLKKGMRLESDPTIIYGLKNYDGNIRKADIRRPHPWNTYVIPALPPTPIAGPGVEAIDGVLWPEETEAIFFVAMGDGTHYFSKTYAEHSRAVDRYQRKRRRSK